MRSEYLMVDGVRTHILRAGQGKPLLLIHGLGAPQMWQRVIEPLSSTFEVIAVTLPGFGESDCPPKLFSTNDYAVFLYSLIGRVTTSPVSIVGVSYGGQIAATFASMFPEHLINLVLIASTGLEQPRWYARYDLVWKSIALMMKHTILRNTVALGILSRRSYYDVRNRPDGFVEKFAQPFSEHGKCDAWLNALRNVLSPDPGFRKMITAIHHPTLIVWGAQDTSVLVKYAHEFQRSLPHSQQKILSNCGHSVPMEKPNELCEAIRNFIIQTALANLDHKSKS